MVTNSLDQFIGKEIGFVSVTVPQEHERRYEMPAWWTKMLSVIGVFPLILRRAEHYPHALTVSVRLPARVTSAYTQGHFGGVPFGTAPQGTEHKDVGREDEFTITRDLIDVVAQGAGAYQDPIRFVVDRALRPLVEALAETKLREAVTEIVMTSMAYEKARAEGLDESGLASQDWKLSSLRFAAERAGEFARRLAEIRRTTKFYADYPDLAEKNLTRAFVEKYIEGLKAPQATQVEVRS